MKTYTKLLILVVGTAAFLASCQCRTCTKDSKPSQQFCKDGGSQTDYDNTIAAYESAGYKCN